MGKIRQRGKGKGRAGDIKGDVANNRRSRGKGRRLIERKEKHREKNGVKNVEGTG